MTEIAPFHALRYNPYEISFISRVVAPPYDVIDKDMAAKLHERDQYNVIRLILGKSPKEARSALDYDQAAKHLEVWRQEGVLLRDEEPSVYVVEQEFDVGEQRLCRRGVVCAVRLEEFGAGSIMPHEQTMDGPKADRFELIKACETSLSQVFGVFSDSDGAADALLERLTDATPIYEYRDTDGIANTVYQVTDPAAIEELAALMAKEVTVIADGHHRYETALKYRDEFRDPAAAPGTAAQDYVAMFCVSVANSGLNILPTHRLAMADGDFDVDAFKATVAERFEIETRKIDGATHLEPIFRPYSEQGNCLGCFVREQTLLVLRPRPGAFDDIALDAGETLKALPVAQLHFGILEPLFGIPTGAGSGHPRLEFTQDIESMFWAVESLRFDAAFLLPPTDPATVIKVAQDGNRMPPKSTYFYPKIPTGLVFYPYDGQEFGHKAAE